MSQFYVTTPLYYVNDKPHVGHAYTTIAADVISRWHKMQGNSVHLLTGTDEHGQKVFEAAEKRNLSPKEHTDNMVLPFQELWKSLDIEFDDFIRTTETRHVSVVQAILNQLHTNGDIYKDYYEGWYSTSAERFWTEKDLVDGKCPDTGLAVEWIKEKNYFFKMSKYAKQLRSWIEDNPNFIEPAARKNEVLGYLKKDIGDLCISRPKTRLPWGISLPFDDDYVTYVWFDALTNYISAIGYHPDGSSDFFERLWPANYQLIGKDILTTHAVYWSTMLFALGLEPAKCLYAHGWWTVEGQKMSKSIGNVVDPHLLIKNYGSDSVRYFLLRQIPFGVDGNFSHNDFLTRYNSDLANGIGNLFQRAIGLLKNSHQGIIPTLGSATENDQGLEKAVQEAVATYTKEFEALHFFHAIEALQLLIQKGNQYIQKEAPWKLAKTDVDRCGQVLRRALEISRITAWLLAPIMPNKAKELLDQIGVTEFGHLSDFEGITEGFQTVMGKPLFPKMKNLPEDIQVARDKALGIEPVAKIDEQPKQKTIKSKVFKRVPFQAGKIVSVSSSDDGHTVEVDIGIDSPLLISGAKLASLSEKNIGQGVVVAGPTNTEDFHKIQILTGQIVEVKAHPEATKLLAMMVDVGEEKPRSIVAGIANRFTPEELLKQNVTVVANLKPSKLRGIESRGMLMAAGGEMLQSLAIPGGDFPSGTPISIFGKEEYFLLLAMPTESAAILQTLSEETLPGSVVR